MRNDNDDLVDVVTDIGEARSDSRDDSRIACFAFLFTSIATDGDNGYHESALQMLDPAAKQPGFLSFEAARQEIGISVSFWASREAIKAWKQHAAHKYAQSRGESWHKVLRVHVCRVEREYGF